MSSYYIEIKPKGPPRPAEVFGHRVEFSRRRYANRHTYTWAYLVLDDEWISLGDPYPGVHWRRAELERAVRLALERHGLGGEA